MVLAERTCSFFVWENGVEKRLIDMTGNNGEGSCMEEEKILRYIYGRKRNNPPPFFDKLLRAGYFSAYFGSK